MTKSSAKFIKGMGMGTVVGCVAGVVGYSYMRRNKKGVKRNVGKALRNMSELVENVNGMF
ncbi:MAG: hypothetical protein ACI39E_01410 [Acutalibacteraceae bacterium]